MRRAIGLSLCFATLACSAKVQVPPQAPPAPPTPKTVTVANPGGDASDPEWAALDRLAHEPWATRRDRVGALVIPLPDALNWQRVRLWGYPSRTAFRFGDDHFGVTAVWYKPTTEDSSPEACLARFIAEAQPAAERFGAHVLETHLVHLEHQGRLSAPIALGETPKPPPRAMVVQVIDARVDGIFFTREYAGAVAAAPSWPGTCLIAGFVVPSNKHRELARRVRDRWVTEGAPRLRWTPRVVEAPPVDDK